MLNLVLIKEIAYIVHIVLMMLHVTGASEWSLSDQISSKAINIWNLIGFLNLNLNLMNFIVMDYTKLKNIDTLICIILTVIILFVNGVIWFALILIQVLNSCEILNKNLVGKAMENMYPESPRRVMECMYLKFTLLLSSTL